MHITSTRRATIRVGALSAAIFALGACSATAPASNPRADIAALASSLTAAEQVATAYVTLPDCTTAAGIAQKPLCSTASVVAQIKTDDLKAYTLVKAAEKSAAAGDIALAQAALTTLLTDIKPLPAKTSLLLEPNPFLMVD